MGIANGTKQGFRKNKRTLDIRTYPDFAQPFELKTDASETGLIAVLTQTISGTNYVMA